MTDCARPDCGTELTGLQRKWCSTYCARRMAKPSRDLPDCSRCGRPNGRGGRTRVCLPCYRQSPNMSRRLPGPPEKKVCSFCQVEKPGDSFYPNAARADWLSVYCRACHKTSAKSDYASSAERAKDRRLWSRYNITIDEYNELFQAQGGMCAICGRTPGRMGLVVDHSHAPPCIVRGLLCGPCNRFKVATLTLHDIDAVHEYLHHPPAVAVLGERRVPLGMEKGERRPRRKRRRLKAA